MRLRPAHPLALLAPAAAAVVGCASGDRADPDGPASVRQSMLASAEPGVTERVGVSDNGLEVRKWIVDDDATRIAVAVQRFGEAVELPGTGDETLRINGLRLVRVPQRAVEGFVEALGGSSINHATWFGQTFEWRELHARALGSAGTVVAIDGRVRRLADVEAGLLVRAWTIKTEDGPFIHVQILPGYWAARGGGLRRSIADGAMRFRGEILPSMLVEARLDARFAYILTCESTSIDWTELPEPQTQRDDAARAAANAPRHDVRGVLSPLDVVGPEALGPGTIGEAMLRGGGERPLRGIIVLLPRIPAAMYPPDLIDVADDVAAGPVR